MKKILIVDDEPHVSTILKQFLERTNYQVNVAMNGHQALEKIAQDFPDLIITDVQMPKMNGIELCENIHKEYPGQIKLIIIMTSRTDSDIRTWVDPHQHIELMEKPVSMRRLTARLKDHFSAEGL